MADVKISALPAASGVTADDLVPIVNDPSGTAATQKATAAQLASYIQSSAGGVPAEGRPSLSGTPQYTLPGVDISAINTAQPGANTLRYMPIYVATPITIDQLAIEVTTLAASSTVRIGLYRADTDWQPTALLLDSGAIDTSGTGVKTASVNQALTPGRYLLAVQSNSGVVGLRIWRGGSRYAGFPAAMGANFIAGLSKAQAYAAYIDPGIAWDTITAGSTPFNYYAMVRVATP